MVNTNDQVWLQKLESVLEKFDGLTQSLSDPRVISEPAQYQRLAKERADIEELVERFRQYKAVLKDLGSTEELLRDANAEPGMQELAENEHRALADRKSQLEQQLRLLLLPKDPRDEKNTILEIRAGTGGDEAALFSAELFRMYTRYAENHRWRVEIMSSSPTGIGGLKEIIAVIEGRGAYRRLKYESGVHRVQRVPVTEAGGRIHTSAVTVAVLPEAEEVDITIDPSDLRIDTFCSSGPGGQGVNTTHSAVRITHVPTGTVVSCQDERSQLKNKNKAMRVLRSRLLEVEKSRQEAETARTRKSQVGTGDRSEKIRTYNFPQNRVTDHRVGLTLHRLNQVLEGDLDELIEALIADEQADRLNTVMAS
jgi:peptide chain release factor 1